MATYPVVNKQTGEQKEVVLSIHDWDQWKQDNPDWERDWSDPSTLPGSGEIGDWRDKMKKTHPGFHDIIRNKIGVKSPRNRTIHDKYN
jgi:hypothetical protein